MGSKGKKMSMPMDVLGIFNLQEDMIVVFKRLKSYEVEDGTKLPRTVSEDRIRNADFKLSWMDMKKNFLTIKAIFKKRNRLPQELAFPSMECFHQFSTG